MRKLITVVVPVYNSARYLDRCIQSIIKQTYKNIEVILINDGSIDESLKICLKYEKKDNRIKVINKENSGVSCTRNIGIEASRGDYIVFVDSDDFLKYDMIEKLVGVQLMSKNNITFCGFNTIDYMGNSKKVNIEKSLSIEIEEFFKKYIHVFFENILILPLWNKIFELSVIKNNNIKFKEDFSMFEDTIFILEYLNNVKGISYINETLYNYCANQQSITSKYRYKTYESFKYFWKFTKESVLKYDVERECYLRLKSNFIDRYFVIMKSYYISGEDNKKWNYIKRISRQDGIRDLFEIKDIKNIKLKIKVIAMKYPINYIFYLYLLLKHKRR